jgi:hypothetical protein
VKLSRFVPFAAALLPVVGAALIGACTTKQPTESTYFSRTIQPILTTSCVRAPTGAGCHVADARGNALGNLDVSTYENITKRRDLLVDYGPYGQPALLMKNVPPFQAEIQGYDGVKTTITTDIKHAGGSILDPTATGYETIRRWIDNGATENNTGVPPKSVERLPCTSALPGRSDFDLTQDPARPDFATFRDKVNPILSGHASGDLGKIACGASNCHGNLSNSLYLTCGDTPEALRWNYLAAQEYLAQTPEQSELLRRPLAPTQGGAFHEGGVIFTSPSDEGYQTLEAWAAEHGPATSSNNDPGFLFFSHRVQPALVKKGCLMLQCHSASMFHDYRLHGGSSGSFSLSATRQNYDLSLKQLALEAADPNASRLVRKNLYRPEVCGVAGCDKPVGLAHRGGPLFEDFQGQRASADLCTKANPAYDYDKGDLDTIPAYCVVGEWLRREQAARKLAPLSAIVYVARPAGSVKRAQDFDVYAPGADLRRIPATITNGALAVTANDDKSLTAGCGLSPQSADIRRPQVSWDGTRIAFAARSSASEPLEIYEMNADGTACAKHPIIDGTPPSQNGILVHNFDPTYAPPDGGFSRIVFASTRGNIQQDAFDYKGPQHTPADPTKPNSNLYILEPDPAAPAQTRVRQLTYLLNMERQPSFMIDGRIIFATEKRAPGFYQIALRRQNPDSGDYHPLYAQRGSIGYPEATQVVELADKDFASVFSVPATPGGGGALGVFNRSLGVDFQSGDPADYPIDPGVIDPSQPQAPEPDFFLHSLRFPDGAANARPGKPTSGLYASPSALPSTSMLVSFGAASDPGAFGGDYDVYEMDPVTGAKTKLFGAPGSAEVEAVAVYARAPRTLFKSSFDEPNGHTQILDGQPEAEITVLDFRLLASLLFQNTPTGRLIDPEIKSVTVLEDLPPVDPIDPSFVAKDAFGSVYVRRRPLGIVGVEDDGSAKFRIPGGVPIVLQLPDTTLSKQRSLPRIQREEMDFSPGEYVHQGFRTELFGALCGQCHGAVSGRPVDTALDPDFVTQASVTTSRFKTPFEMNKPPDQRGPISGPSPTP